jgi:hypothetical protein
MVTVLITSFLLLAAIIYAAYRWQSEPPNRSTEEYSLPPGPAGWTGLFGEDANQKQIASETELAAREKERDAIIARAGRGEKGALAEAAANDDPLLYEEVLGRLLEQADSDKKLLALVSYMTTQTPPLPVNRPLAERFIEVWKLAPDRGSTAKMLHITALADDAELYRRAIETAIKFWRDERIEGLSAEELRQLSESEYWILSQIERSSGQGFLLKLRLAALRRELTRGG